MIRSASILGPRLWSGLHVCGAKVKRSSPHFEKAGRFGEAESGAEHTCPWKVLALAIWIDKGFFLEEMYYRAFSHRSHRGFFENYVIFYS